MIIEAERINNIEIIDNGDKCGLRLRVDMHNRNVEDLLARLAEEYGDDKLIEIINANRS